MWLLKTGQKSFKSGQSQEIFFHCHIKGGHRAQPESKAAGALSWPVSFVWNV